MKFMSHIIKRLLLRIKAGYAEGITKEVNDMYVRASLKTQWIRTGVYTVLFALTILGFLLFYGHRLSGAATTSIIGEQKPWSCFSTMRMTRRREKA